MHRDNKTPRPRRANFNNTNNNNLIYIEPFAIRYRGARLTFLFMNFVSNVLENSIDYVICLFEAISRLIYVTSNCCILISGGFSGG